MRCSTTIDWQNNEGVMKVYYPNSLSLLNNKSFPTVKSA